MSKFGFGSTPASTGFSFGTPKTTATAFGTSTTTTPQGGFGSGNMSFGANTSNVSFGAPPANSTLNFGAPTTGFGTTTPAKPAFGATAPTGFGSLPTTTPFGTPTANTGFGSTPIGSSFNAPTTNIGFGTTNTAFTATTTAAAPAFGTTPTSLSFGGTNTFGTSINSGTGLFESSNRPNLTQGPVNSSDSFFDPFLDDPNGNRFQTMNFQSENQQFIKLFNNRQCVTCNCDIIMCKCLTVNEKNINENACNTPTHPVSSENPNIINSPKHFDGNQTLSLLYPSPGPGHNVKYIIPGSNKPSGLGGFGTSSLLTGTANTTTLITTPASQGLGGIDTTASKPSGINTNRSEDPPVRENQLPNELSTTVDSFKQFVKEQRLLSADIARGSIEPVQKVSEEVSTLQGILSSLCSDIQKNAFSTNRLKNDMSTALGHAEMAQRTHEVPPGLQYENTAPLTYFMELVQSYERELLLFREKIELTDKHLHSLVQPKQVGEQDLTQGMRQIHETLITLAGRLQGVHHEVQAQKQMYLQLRRVVLDDGTDVFASKNRGNYQSPVKRGGAGPTPFIPGGLLGSGLNPKQLTSVDNKSTQIFNNTSIGGSSWGWGTTPIGATGSSTTAFGSGAGTGDTFNLQRPPIGNKRGKH